MAWRDEIDVVLREWVAALGGDQGGQRWRRIGAARQAGEPGLYAVDIRGSDLAAEQPDSLCLAGPEQQEPAFLVTALREGLASLADAGLANLLARGEVAGVPSDADAPPGLLPAQQAAYQACLGTGLWLVWGPPGTGKTRVLQAAICDLMAAGKRVLLVSGTNIAVDNALRGVVRERRHQPGDIVRVGPPQLREIADDPQVCLPLMVRTRLAEAEERRQAVAVDLLEMNRRRERLRDLEARLSGFDPVAYQRAADSLAACGGSAAEAGRALARSEAQAEAAGRALEDARAELRAARESAAEADPVRPAWAEIEAMEADLTRAARAAARSDARELVAKDACDNAGDQVTALTKSNGKVRWRDRGAFRDTRDLLSVKQEEYADLRDAAGRARATVTALQRNIAAATAELSAASALGRDEIRRRDAAAGRAGTRMTERELARDAVLNQLAARREANDAALAAERLIADCARHGWPDIHARAAALRAETTRDDARRPDAEKRHAELQEQYERLARDAQGEIIRAARLVATTLARFRAVKAVLDGPYDVVLIDEVGAATLPEVLLAVAKASRCAVLLGDFMQLGPVIPQSLGNSDRADIRRWLVTDAFRHCGIGNTTDAAHHAACLVLDTQHRFGPHIMRFANLLAYDGLLKPGGAVRAHGDSDPEIVLADTDGLDELAAVRRTSASAGWWAAGLLLSRALVEMHHDNGETTGVVTPYTVQAEATLEALRDVEPGGRPLAEVGTAHRFQGREFPIVVFDTVESRYGRPIRPGGHAPRRGARPACRDQRHRRRAFVLRTFRAGDLRRPGVDLALVRLGGVPRAHDPAVAQGRGRQGCQGHGLRPRPERQPSAQDALRRGPGGPARRGSHRGGGERQPREGHRHRRPHRHDGQPQHAFPAAEPGGDDHHAGPSLGPEAAQSPARRRVQQTAPLRSLPRPASRPPPRGQRPLVLALLQRGLPGPGQGQVPGMDTRGHLRLTPQPFFT